MFGIQQAAERRLWSLYSCELVEIMTDCDLKKKGKDKRRGEEVEGVGGMYNVQPKT